MPSQPIIQVQNVSKVFNVKAQDILVLKNINLEITVGEFVVIFGPSGSGKSTLLNVILGLEPATTGTVMVQHLNISDATSEDELAIFRKRNIGIVYQQTNWIKALNVVDNVSFALELMGVDKFTSHQKALEILDLVGMKGWANFSPTELSAGQQQKVALARALITNPEILVADEPTGNLDYQSGLELMALFKKLQKQGKTIIMITHNPENLEYASHIIQVFDGSIIQNLHTEGQDIEQIKTQLIQKIDKSLVKVNSQITLEDIKFMSATVTKRASINSLIKVARNFSLFKWIGNLIQVISFTLFMMLNLVQSTVLALLNLPFWGETVRRKLIAFTTRIYGFAARILHSKYTNDSINPLSLVDLSVKHLLNKRTRSIITIGGVALGIGFIVFLVSLGYGLENLVVSRVASLKERRQIDVIPVVSSNLAINDQTIENFEEISGVEKVLPFISIAGKVSYQNSSTDSVAYGVLTEYLSEEDVTPVVGGIFDNDQLFFPPGEDVSVSDAIEETEDVIDVELPQTSRTAVINDSFMQVLGLQPLNAIGKKFSVEFTVTGDLVTGGSQVKSLPVEYEIVGVTDDTRSQIMYIPILDAKQLGITRYSQVKIVVDSEENVPTVRNLIEFLGYRTTSVLDTVTQIEQLFSNVRILLVVVGAIALAVAALGMFNTLTVSLLERTREVGLMKAIGMRSDEVKLLFINESVIMGILGGGGGLLLGFLMGKLISALLSVVSVTRGAEGIDISLIPGGVVVLILLLSIFIGVVTGIFPAVRATKISALNALRYE
ncbi:MAG: ATP-binding cassette domain-containing protein [Candidatus Doudnabacteria bacterium]|nr:ATP-binding cassette domain-containing protein [Candidatus Doudnabacteria bacterium]